MADKRYADMTDNELLAAVPQWYKCSPEEAIKFREQIVPRLDAGDTFTFDGDANCNDLNGDCAWDGIDRRCNCGNRRVSWTCDHGHWRGEAY